MISWQQRNFFNVIKLISWNGGIMESISYAGHLFPCVIFFPRAVSSINHCKNKTLYFKFFIILRAYLNVYGKSCPLCLTLDFISHHLVHVVNVSKTLQLELQFQVSVVPKLHLMNCIYSLNHALVRYN